jgi:hypothetical protein
MHFGALEARSETFKLVTALQSLKVAFEGQEKPAEAGQSVDDPWRFKTGPDGRLLLASRSVRLQLQEGSDAALDEPPFQSRDTMPVTSFFKSAEERAKTPPLTGPVLTLNEGTLLIQSGPRPVSVRASGMHIDARNALFAVMTHSRQDKRVTVLKGQVKVKHPDKKVTIVPQGKSLHTGAANEPALSPLEEHPDSVAHKIQLALLEAELRERGEDAAPTPGAVGKGAQVSFDLRQRRAAALLTAPDPDNTDRPDVSPEQPAPE